MNVRPVPWLLLAVVVQLATGCSGGSDVSAEQVVTPYDGPLHVPFDQSRGATVLEAAGAAGLALECSGEPRRGSGEDQDEEGRSGAVRGSPETALGAWLDSTAAQVPRDGYRIEREGERRALLSWDVDGRTRAAVIVRNGIADAIGETGWAVEASALCDPAELGIDVAEGLGFEIWTDADGDPVPTSDVYSYAGPEHCDWQDITFVHVGQVSDRDRSYDLYLSGNHVPPVPDLFTTQPDLSASLPDDATDTGWRHDGRELWIGTDPRAAYLVDVDDDSDVQLWPAPRVPIGCA